MHHNQLHLYSHTVHETIPHTHFHTEQLCPHHLPLHVIHGGCKTDSKTAQKVGKTFLVTLEQKSARKFNITFSYLEKNIITPFTQNLRGKRFSALFDRSALHYCMQLYIYVTGPRKTTLIARVEIFYFIVGSNKALSYSVRMIPRSPT